MKKIGFVILFFLNIGALYATHQKAAEITYQHVSGYTYQITIITYTYTGSLADRPQLDIFWGYQDQFSAVARINEIVYGKDEIKENHYIAYHTFPGPGTYLISLEDPNRNAGVLNMQNSINTPMYVESKLVISPFISPGNSSPTLLNKPIDKGCLGLPFMHNPGAYDLDGDSLSYALVPCRGTSGFDAPGYALPKASDSIRIDPVTGDLYWDSPLSNGEYNLAILIEEHRYGVRIGSVVRDMQITIQSCENRLPEVQVDEKICAFAGTELRVPVKAQDPDSTDILTLSATAGIFYLSKDSAYFASKTGLSPLFDTLVWTPQQEHVQQNPYPVYFRAQDNGTPNLNALKTLLIHVIGRAPKWDALTANFNEIMLKWNPVIHQSILGYRIFRTLSNTGLSPDSCDYGMTDTTYQLLAELNDHTLSSFSDTSVLQNLHYCYRILTVYKNGMESQMSDEICGSLLSNKPILEKVSVDTTDVNNGKIQLAWRKPLDFDITSNAHQYLYILHKSLGTNNFEPLDTIQNINDTTYLDRYLNTLENYYYYKIELLQNLVDTTISIGFSSPATPVFAHATGKNKRVNVQWDASQPWKTEGFGVFRKKSWQADFDSIGYTTQTYFTDTTVLNDTSYTYKIKAFGRHYSERINDYILINWSQETSAIPQLDTPCRPDLTLDYSGCKPAENHLSWIPFDPDCNDENSTYHIFYTASINEPFREIGTTTENRFVHQEMQMNIGRYYVTASNIKNLTSEPSDTVHIDPTKCLKYELPNVFTPNDDGFNDVYKALPNEYAGKFTLKIYNRWGNLVFESEDPDFQWNGKNQTSKKPCPEGTYFYVAELYAQGWESVFKETLKGFITLLR